MAHQLTHLARWIFSTALVVASVSVLLISVPLFGNTALIVRSGSMSPTIAVGDLVVVRRQTAPYKVGDIVAYRSGRANDIITTHRITDVRENADARVSVTKGDANSAADAVPVTESQVLGRLFLRVPLLGRLLAFAKTLPGFLALIVLPLLVTIGSEARVIVRELRAKAGGRSADAGVTKAALVLLVCGLLVSVPATFAFFSDTGSSLDNIFAASASFGTDHLVLSEVQIKGSNANNDFVELYNPTGVSVDLSSWRIRKKNSAGTESSFVLIGSGKSIPAHGFFLWANSTGGYDASISADVSNTNTLSENNSIALMPPSPSTTIVDQVAWGTTSNPQFVEGTAFTPSPDSNQSIERKAKSTSTAATMGSGGADEFKGNQFDSNTNATDFILRSVSQPQNSGSATETP